MLPCDHFFHQGCIDRWFATKAYQVRSCPLCKRDPLEGHVPQPFATLAQHGEAGEASAGPEAREAAVREVEARDLESGALMLGAVHGGATAGDERGTELSSVGQARAEAAEAEPSTPSDGSVEVLELPPATDAGRSS